MAVRLKTAVICCFLGVLVFATFGERTRAQVQTTGVIGGTVVDSVGVVPGARVTLVSQDTLAVRTTITNEVGTFRFASVVPGRYVVKIEVAGFRPLTVEAFTLGAGETRDFPKLVLQAGGVTESVSVVSQVTPVEVGSSSRQQGITTDQIGSIQMRGRDIYGFITTRPGVVDGNVSQQAPGTENYAHIPPSPFRSTTTMPVSTFAADVDTASYTNVRRFLRDGQLPPRDAVRIEEFVNYFRFHYPEPTANQPVSITTEVGDCPWAPGHQLALIGVRAKSPAMDDERPRRIVLLLDVSGSMMPPDRLPLIKSALNMFVDTLRDDDRLAIVVYAGASGLALPSTTGSDRARIHDALERLQAGGSTNGADGIQLAYQVARQRFVPGGINRVILATDGDFNVGITQQSDLVRLIEQEKAGGIFLSVLGVGRGNLKDSTMEMLADKGNGHYVYLDSLQEARRVLVAEGGSTLETVAKDVKLQVEFNPARVAAWKLIGYDDRLLARQDFNDDSKDGGEMGAGHTVTALYQIVSVGTDMTERVDSDGPRVDPLIYQTNERPATNASRDLFTVKIRYKLPDANESAVMTRAVRPGGPATDVPFAAAVAEFGALFRDPAGERSRWDALAYRINLMTPVIDPVEHNDFATLVATAANLERMRMSAMLR